MSKTTSEYLSARKLGITAGERKWLLETKDVLAKLRDGKSAKVNGLSMRFDMGVEIDIDEPEQQTGDLCNTVGCIRGWMGVLAVHARKGKDLNIPTNSMVRCIYERWPEHWNYSGSLRQLFYPDAVHYHMVTPKIAAHAIDSFLHGDQCIEWGAAQQ